MSVYESPTNALANNLILCIDPNNAFSYSGSGTNLTDISPLFNQATLLNMGFNTSIVAPLGVLSFNGIQGSYIQGLSFPTITTGQGLTFSGWYYLNGINTYSLFNAHVGITTLFAVVEMLGNLFSKNNAGLYSLNTPIYANQWINICITYSSNGLGASSYINGNFVNNFPAGIITGNTGGATFLIGHNGLNSTYEIFNGYLGLLNIYNVALTSTQVSQVFNAFRSRFGL